MWFVPYDAVGLYRYQCSAHVSMNGHINILPMPSDVSANDISGGHVFANSLISNGIVINGDISGNTGKFANGIMNTLAISDNLDCSNAFIENLDCSNVFITDLSANDISGGHVFANTLTIAGDLSGNNARLYDVSVNRLWIGDVEMIGHIPGDISGPTNTGTLTGNMIFNGDLSGNDASFNVVDVKQLSISNSSLNLGSEAAGDLRYYSGKFQGHNGTKWIGLGGVISDNEKVTITAHDTNGLQFYTDDGGVPGKTERMSILNNGTVNIGNITNVESAIDLKANTADVTTNLASKAPKENPTFTGTVSGITKTMVGLGAVDNYSKATMFSSPTFTGIVSGNFSGNLTGNADTATEATNVTFTNSQSDDGYYVPFAATSGPTRCQLYYNSTESNSIYFNPSTGRLGIGTVSPNYKLHVKGAIVSQGSDHWTYINKGTAEHTYISGGKNNSNVYINDEQVVGSHQDGHVKIGGKGAKLFVFHNGGNATTSSGLPSSDGLRIDHNQIMTNGSNILYLNYGGSGPVNICNGGVVVNNTSMGIGTDSPYAPLNIYTDNTGNTGNEYPMDNASWSTASTPEGFATNKGIINSTKTVSMFLGKGDDSATKNYYGLLIGTHSSSPSESYLQGINVYAGTTLPIMLNPNGGNVCIGNSTPYYPLHVSGGESWSGGTSRKYFDYSLTNWSPTTTSSFTLGVDISHYCWAKGYTTSSDERIKKNIRDLSDNDSLIKLRDISCVHYEYKDEIKNGGKPTIGFIAQQVASIYPGAVSLVPEYIPNEYRILTDISWDEVTRTDSTGNTETIYYLTSESMGDVSGCKYRFECRDLSANIEEIEIELKGDEYNRFEFKYKYPEIFLYGKEVDDFHILDKPRLFAINFSATQEIDKIQQAEKTKLEKQTSKLAAAETEIATLKTTLTDVLSRLAALELN